MGLNSIFLVLSDQFRCLVDKILSSEELSFLCKRTFLLWELTVIIVIFLCRNTMSMIQCQRLWELILKNLWNLRADQSVTMTFVNTKCLLRLCNRAEDSEEISGMLLFTVHVIEMSIVVKHSVYCSVLSSDKICCYATLIIWDRPITIGNISCSSAMLI